MTKDLSDGDFVLALMMPAILGNPSLSNDAFIARVRAISKRLETMDFCGMFVSSNMKSLLKAQEAAND